MRREVGWRFRFGGDNVKPLPNCTHGCTWKRESPKMLIKLPFTIENEVEGGTKSGDMWVDPGEVAFISRGFDRVHVGMKGGQMLHSAIPKLKTAVIEGTPDGIKLDEWTEKTVELVNSNTGNFMLKN